MNRIDHAWQRLLRAARAAEGQRDTVTARTPDARWLLRQRLREREQERSELAARLLLRQGLAVACLLLMLALLVNVRQIERVRQDVFAQPASVLTRLSSP